MTNFRFHWRSACLILLSLLLVGCRTLAPADFKGAGPRFEPDRFFEGPVRSWGVIESRSGKPRSRVAGTLSGERRGAEVIVTQDLAFDDGHTQHRVWRIWRVDEHRYEAFANDVIGPAVGYAFGNAFHWQYTLQVGRGGFFGRVQMEHWMYLLSDGETMINRVAVRKVGVLLGQVTETFHRGTQSMAASAP